MKRTTLPRIAYVQYTIMASPWGTGLFNFVKLQISTISWRYDSSLAEPAGFPLNRFRISN